MRAKGSYLSRQEQERRYDGLRTTLREAECAVGLIVGPPQIAGKRYYRYFTDWNLQSFGGYLVVPLSDQPSAVLRAWSQAYWSRRVGWIDDVVSERDPLAGALKLIDRHGSQSRVGVVGIDYMSVSDYRRAADALGDRLIDVSSEVDEQMAIKSGEEQRLLRQTGAIFDTAWNAVLDAARPGMAEWELAGVAGASLLSQGVSHSIILIGASSTSSPAACVGWPRDRRLGVRDVVQMSIEGPGPSGYCVEIGGTFSFGRAPRAVQHQWQAQLQGMQRGVRMLTAGTESAAIATAVDAEFTAAGYRTGYPGMHGIGLGIPELPTIDARSHRRLSVGNVLAMHPNAVSNTGVGTLTSRTYVVGEDAPTSLSALPMDFVEL